ncbi:MAG: HAD-IC family P-type ATPase, partial [Pseudomonadota bacterium]
MLLTNIGILTGLYLGKQLQHILRANKTDKRKVEQQISVVKQVESKPKHYVQISGASLLMVSTAHFVYPPLTLLNVVVISYTTVPILQRAFKTMFAEGKIKNHVGSSLASVLLLGTGNYFGVSIYNVVYHLSEHFIQRSREKSARLGAEVFQQAPEMVWIAYNGVEQQIPLAQVQIDDVVIVTTGEVIPVDGIISTGMALIDQQALTGEANPVEKGSGDTVMASTVILSGRIGIRASHSGEDTRIDKLNKLLQQTESYKTQLQLKGEAWADSITFPLIATTTGLMPFIGTAPALALFLSAPNNTVRSMLSVQTLTHMQHIVKQGIFIKDGRVLEELPRIDTILFDKTGT